MPARPAGGPVYIGGLSRSGKTLMGSILGSHSRLAIPEHGSNLWAYFHGQFGDLADDANMERAISTLLRYRHVVLLSPDEQRIRAEAAAGPRTYGHLFSLFLAHYAEARGKPRWGEHSGLVEAHADRVFEAFPDARIVQMIRDPRDRHEASARLFPRGRGQVGAATAWWSASAGLAERNLRRYPDAYRVLRYEDLVNAPEETVRVVCDFIAEPFEPAMLEMGEAPEYAEMLGRRNEARSATSGLIVPDHVGGFRGVLPDREVAFIEAHAGTLMRRHGYALDRPEPSWRERGRLVLVDPAQTVRLLATVVVARTHHRLLWVARRTIAAKVHQGPLPG
ncbi:hypothetical protein BH23CHL8_BH23CHL8_19140 [soil metagenome]